MVLCSPLEDKSDRCYGDSEPSLTRESAETGRNHNDDGTLLENAADTHTHTHAHASAHTHAHTHTHTHTVADCQLEIQTELNTLKENRKFSLRLEPPIKTLSFLL